ncbi:TlpA disulfide reductase family protein [Draconibacterium halophilum]|uniref:AhpC/TSA family protein n=1 Tax=Draconibacterium halophilum TaxID=2706887 RepID=A0A6C0RE25_9BACT|nr:TlpA disulfide reductase family protein [Draconibacterium halophilum]QIA08794.1 AhpC/TSA family protein [Draconibacterium halophilum]
MRNISFKLFVLSILILFLINCQKPDGFIIKGYLTNADGKKVYITQRGGGLSSGSKVELLDSCIVKNGKFQFHGNLDEPNYYSVLVENTKGWKHFILDCNSMLTIDGNADSIWKATISGSADNKLLDSLKIELTSLYKTNKEIWDSIRVARKQKDEIRIKELYAERALLDKEILNHRINFIRKHPDSFESLIQLSIIYDDGRNEENTIELFDIISDKLKQHSVGKEIHYQLFELKDFLSQPVSFTQPDTTGELISTDSFKGNYLLIEFWASWCGPCRAENPNLKEAYNKFNKKGFEIIAVSLDTKKQNWINAIREDNLNWIHVSDLKGWKNEIAQKYVITSVPSNLLLDKDGNIIAKDLKGEKLYKKITELYE